MYKSAKIKMKYFVITPKLFLIFRLSKFESSTHFQLIKSRVELALTFLIKIKSDLKQINLGNYRELKY